VGGEELGDPARRGGDDLGGREATVDDERAPVGADLRNGGTGTGVTRKPAPSANAARASSAVRSVPTPTTVSGDCARRCFSASRQPGVVAVSSMAGTPCSIAHSAMCRASSAVGVRMTGTTTAAAMARAADSAKPVSCMI
jgi:hypothetical protein